MARLRFVACLRSAYEIVDEVAGRGDKTEHQNPKQRAQQRGMIARDMAKE
jgi:hypothetical protein